MPRLTLTAALTALMLTGAIFGFFYAWTVSTLWGLDAADPRTAIAAMQAMNASVRNAAFAPAFFGTAPALLLAAALASRQDQVAGAAFAGAALAYMLGAFALTIGFNIPLNEALAARPAPADPDAAATIWAAYSPRWQMFNQIRTLASGAALLLAALGLWRLGAAAAQPHHIDRAARPGHSAS